jgi:hypothetical protein
MNPADLVAARKKAEEAVKDMADGQLKLKAFEVILASLLSPGRPAANAELSGASSEAPKSRAPSSLAARVSMLAGEGFFAQPRSLADIQAKLAERGWHYPQTNLSTPLIRLVRQRELRRLQAADGNKKVWKYSLP